MLVFPLSVGTGRKKWRKLQATCLLVFYSDYVYAAPSLAWHSCSSITEYSIPHWDLSKHSLVDSWVVAVDLLPEYGEAFLMFEDLIL